MLNLTFAMITSSSAEKPVMKTRLGRARHMLNMERKELGTLQMEVREQSGAEYGASSSDRGIGALINLRFDAPRRSESLSLFPHVHQDHRDPTSCS